MNFFNLVLIGLIFLSLLVIIIILGKNLGKISKIKKQEIRGIDSGVAKKSFGKKVSGFFIGIVEWVAKTTKRGLSSIQNKIARKKQKEDDFNLENDLIDEVSDEISIETTSIVDEPAPREGKKGNLSSSRLSERSRFSFTADEDDGLDDFSRKDWNLDDSKKKVDADFNKSNDLKDESSDDLVQKFFSEKKQEEDYEGRRQIQEADRIEPAETTQRPEMMEARNVAHHQPQPLSQPENLAEMIEQEEALQEEKEGFIKKLFGKFKRKGISPEENGAGDSFEDPSQGRNLIKEVVKREKPEGLDADEELGIDRKMLEERILQKVASDPKNVENYRQLGELYIKMRNFDDARRTYRYILKLDPRDSEAARRIEKINLLERFSA